MAERLAVLLSGEVVGHLERKDSSDDPAFSYTAAYVRSGEVALSARLPIQSGPHPAQRVKPYLSGLLPENDDARIAWSDDLGVDKDDAFGILAAMGWDCPGAVRFCREEDLEELRRRDGEHLPTSETEIADLALSIGGERDASRSRRQQLKKAAGTLSLAPELLIGRAAVLVEAFPTAFGSTQ